MNDLNLVEKRRDILRQVAEGYLTAQEGAARLDQLESGAGTLTSEQLSSGDDPVRVSQPDLPITASHGSGGARAVWSLVLWAGVALTVASSYWMYLAWQQKGFGWGFWLSWLPFLLAVGLIILGVQLQTSPWLHLHVKQKSGSKPERIELHFPLPMDLAIGILSFTEPFLPSQVREQHLRDMLIDMRGAFHPGEPMQVMVDNEDGEQVEIYIG